MMRVMVESPFVDHGIFRRRGSVIDVPLDEGRGLVREGTASDYVEWLRARAAEEGFALVRMRRRAGCRDGAD